MIRSSRLCLRSRLKLRFGRGRCRHCAEVFIKGRSGITFGQIEKRHAFVGYLRGEPADHRDAVSAHDILYFARILVEIIFALYAAVGGDYLRAYIFCSFVLSGVLPVLIARRAVVGDLHAFRRYQFLDDYFRNLQFIGVVDTEKIKKLQESI